MSRHDRGRRLRASALEFVETSIPVIRHAIRDRIGEAYDVRQSLGMVANLLIRYSLESPTDSAGRQALAIEIEAAKAAFDQMLNARGLWWNPSESQVGVSIRLLSTEVAKIVAQLRETDGLG